MKILTIVAILLTSCSIDGTTHRQYISDKNVIVCVRGQQVAVWSSGVGGFSVTLLNGDGTPKPCDGYTRGGNGK